MFRRFTEARISLRLPALIVGTLIMTIVIASETYYAQFQKEAEVAAALKSQSVTDQVSNGLESWLLTLENQLTTLAEDPNTTHTLTRFSDSVQAGSSVDLHDIRSVSDIPQVACRLTSRSPDFARWTSVFRAERRLRSRKRLELGGSGREPAASFPGSDVFQRCGQTCRASFVEFWPISRLRA